MCDGHRRQDSPGRQIVSQTVRQLEDVAWLAAADRVVGEVDGAQATPSLKEQRDPRADDALHKCSAGEARGGCLHRGRRQGILAPGVRAVAFTPSSATPLFFDIRKPCSKLSGCAVRPTRLYYVSSRVNWASAAAQAPSG